MAKPLTAAERALDIAIATRLGWVHVETPDDTEHWERWDAPADWPVSKYWPGPPPFSTDIRVAWWLLDWLRKSWSHVVLDCRDGEEWRCIVYQPSPGSYLEGFARGSAPLAICRTVLRVAGAALEKQDG